MFDLQYIRLDIKNPAESIFCYRFWYFMEAAILSILLLISHAVPKQKINNEQVRRCNFN